MRQCWERCLGYKESAAVTLLRLRYGRDERSVCVGKEDAAVHLLRLRYVSDERETLERGAAVTLLRLMCSTAVMGEVFTL